MRCRILHERGPFESVYQGCNGIPSRRIMVIDRHNCFNEIIDSTKITFSNIIIDVHS